jgi:UDP-N-acetylglucosamine 3-dehydrogenase
MRSTRQQQWEHEVLRAGLVGLGVMGSHHMRILSQLDGVEFVGVHDPALAGETTVVGKRVYGDIENLIEAGLDYCIIAAPTAFHLDLGLALAAAGIHCLIEKPVAPNHHDALHLVDAFDKAGLIGGVGHIERFNPALQAMRQKIEDGLLGDILQISTRRQGPFPARIADVGVVKDLATHDIDLTAWVAQSPYRNVDARTTHRSGRIHEDMVVAVGELENGTIVNHVVNWLSPFKERNTTVIGDKGALVADTLTADLTFFENGTVRGEWDSMQAFRGVAEGDVTRFALKKIEPLLTEHLAFRDAVMTNDQSGIVTLREGLAAVRIADNMISQ